ncbi:MAG: sporulation transcription factor Spo0A [Anaerostipes sp.]|uniref:sporulation transcription factor Spo0A n=1 Tax=Anaerostipes sp. TaxID=1872530 RepID=UPI00399431B5
MSEKYSVLIADNYSEEIRQLQEELSKKFDVVSANNDGIQAFDNIIQLHPDIVVLDLMLPGLDGIGVIERCREEMEEEELPSFIVLTSIGTQNLMEYLCYMGIDYCMMKPFQPEMLLHRMEQLTRLRSLHTEIQKNENSNRRGRICETNDIRRDVSLLARELGIPAHIKGYQYLRSGIVMAVEDSNMVNYITKLLYPSIAKEYKTTSSSVERAIRHAIDIVWNRGNQKLLGEIFGSFVHSGQDRPTNSEFIAVIADRIRLEYQMNAS